MGYLGFFINSKNHKNINFPSDTFIVPEGNILIRRAAVARPWISIFVVAANSKEIGAV